MRFRRGVVQFDGPRRGGFRSGQGLLLAGKQTLIAQIVPGSAPVHAVGRHECRCVLRRTRCRLVAMIVRGVVHGDRTNRRASGSSHWEASPSARSSCCSYGLALLAIVPLGVAWQARRVTALVPAAIGVATVLGAACIAGYFNYLSGLRATRGEYGRGVASMRPYSYTLVADLVVFALVVGPAVIVGIARLHDRRLWTLVGGALLFAVRARGSQRDVEARGRAHLGAVQVLGAPSRDRGSGGGHPGPWSADGWRYRWRSRSGCGSLRTGW